MWGERYPFLSHRAVTLAGMTDAYDRARREQLRRSEVMRDAQRHGPPHHSSPGEECSSTDHPEWALLRDDHGRPFALACTRRMATLPVPEAEPGVRLVALPDGWED